MPLRIASKKACVRWTGPLFANHSLALVNREMCLALAEDPEFAGAFDLSIDERGARDSHPGADARLARLAALIAGTESEPRVEVRHLWPPDFQTAAAGRFVLCQPWEFGSLPREWVAQIDRCVDEVWAYTRYIRQVYVDSGVPAEKVRVVPLGVNTALHNPGIAQFDFGRCLQTRAIRPDDYKFLFVGGTIPRKGIDVLLDAFDRSFRAGDPVTLIVKDFGTDSFYANQGAGLLIRALQAKPGGTRIVYITEELTDAQMASLYAACDCLVHPYRGEGFGLPIAEAMACGTPVIVTGGGAATDFVDAECGYLIPSTRRFLDQTEISGMPTVSRPWWLEPDTGELQRLLRHVVDNRTEAAERGRAGAARIAERHTWACAARCAADRLTELAAGEAAATLTSFALPMGLANFGLSALKGLELPGDAEDARYEERKQSALAATRAADWIRAVAELEACLAVRPDDWDALNALAVAKFRAGDRAAAVEALQRGIAGSPVPRDFHHNLAYMLLEDGDERAPLDAMPHAMAAFDASPDVPSIRRTLERCRDAALQTARRVLRSAPGAGRQALKRDERYRSAMAAYRTADAALNGGCAVQAQSVCADAALEEAAQTPHSRISLVMIVKDEERFLRGCLESARGLVDEIVIVDTGSADATPQIAEEYGAKVVRHAWTDDFSEARNVSLEHATGDWALWLDADEEIAPEAAERFREAVETAAPDIGGFMVEFRNWLQSTTRREGTEMAVHHACRLFRLVPGVRFEGRIHEQNMRSLQGLGYRYAYVPGLTVDHFGYASEIMEARNKHARFIRMLTREVEECPDPSLRHFHLFNLGNAYFTFGDWESAVTYLRRSSEQPDTTEAFTGTLFTELATALQHLGRLEEGLAVCAEADALGLQESGVDFARGHCLLHLLRYQEAERAFRDALKIGRMRPRLAQTGDSGTGGYKAQYGLALALVGQERYEEATRACSNALEEQPEFSDARYLLALSLHRLRRVREAKDALFAILRSEPGHTAARRELADLLYASDDFAGALPHFELLLAAEPESFELNSRLARCCERIGADDRAREIYERLRAIRPNSAEICVNLGRVLASSGAENDALQYYAEAIRLDPGYGNAYFNAGDLLYRLRQYNDAANAYIAGLEVCPDQPSGLFVLGNCYVQSSNYEAAALCFKHELSRCPTHHLAKNNLELVEAIALAS